MLDAFLPRFKTISFAAALRVSEAGRFRLSSPCGRTVFALSDSKSQDCRCDHCGCRSLQTCIHEGQHQHRDQRLAIIIASARVRAFIAEHLRLCDGPTPPTLPSNGISSASSIRAKDGNVRLWSSCKHRSGRNDV
jgi:hypothetical protein